MATEVFRDWASTWRDPMAWWAERTPDRVALVETRSGRSYTWRDAEAEVARIAGVLHEAGVGPGDRVAVLMGNRTEQIWLLYASHRVGACLLPLNWRLTADELRPILVRSTPRVVFTEPRFRRFLVEVMAPGSTPGPGTLNAIRVLDVDGGGLEGSGRAGPMEPVLPDPEDPAMILYTSGSTGHPKGAAIPHRQLATNAIATQRGWMLRRDHILSISTPLFHTAGWHAVATPGWYIGATVVLMEGFDQDVFLASLSRHRCTVAFAVPAQLYMLTQTSDWGRPLPHLDRIVTGGAPCPPDLAARVRDAGYPLQEAYGLTECGPNCFRQTPEESAEAVGWVGRPMPLLQVRLRSEGRTVEGAGTGELQLRGPQVFTGYLDEPERTAETFENGWLKTGDVAERSAEGRYRICGRIREMFISGGENVYPAEVEAALADHPGISSVCVVAVPDEKWGEVGRAWVVPESGHDPSAADIRDFARERLAGYKVPKSVGFLDELPLLGSGKVDRAALTRMNVAREPTAASDEG